MLTSRAFYGGALDVQASASLTLPFPLRKVIRAAPVISAIFTLPNPGIRNVGGPFWILFNRGTGPVILRRSDTVEIGTVNAGSQIYIFLLDGQANEGAGDWAIAGDGNSTIGDQGSNTGFNFGSASNPSGLESDMGSAEFPNDPAHGYTLDFGFSVPGLLPDPI